MMMAEKKNKREERENKSRRYIMGSKETEKKIEQRQHQQRK